MNKLASNLRVLIPAIFLCLIGCSDDPEIPDPGEAPVIPPVSTLVMDFDITEADGGRTAAKNNWTYSALNVGFWNLAITTTFAVPVASFAEAFNHEAVYDASISGWVWEYDYPALGNRYTARLEAVKTTTAIEWKMYITREGVFDKFNWYSGTTALNGLSGSWLLNKEPNDPVSFIEVEWVRLENNEVANIGYTNVVPGSDANGDFIFFQKSDNTNYDRDYDIFDKSEDNLTEIQWHSTNKNGRVRDPGHFQDSEFHCWDDMLEDIDCP